MMFERDEHGAFRGIDYYLPNALVTFNTHDLATYAGWRHFRDLKLKRSLGFDPGETDDDRWHALTMLDQVLGQHGIHDNNLNAIAEFLARTKSRLMAIALEDLLGLQGAAQRSRHHRRASELAAPHAARASTRSRRSVDVDGLEGGDARADAGKRLRAGGRLTVNWIALQDRRLRPDRRL